MWTDGLQGQARALEPVKTGKGGADKNETFYHPRLKCTHGTAGGGVREGSRTGDGQENQEGMQPLVAATEAIASQTDSLFHCLLFIFKITFQFTS